MFSIVVITMPPDDLAPWGARSSADTVMTKFGSSICNGSSIWGGPSSLLDIMFSIMSDSFATPVYPRPITILTSNAIHHQGSPFPSAPFQSILNQLVQSYLEAMQFCLACTKRFHYNRDHAWISNYSQFFRCKYSSIPYLQFNLWFCVYVMTYWNLKIDTGLASLCY